MNITCTYPVQEENTFQYIQLGELNQNESQVLLTVINNSLSCMVCDNETGLNYNASFEPGLVILSIDNFNSLDFPLTYWCRMESNMFTSLDDSLTLTPVNCKFSLKYKSSLVYCSPRSLFECSEMNINISIIIQILNFHNVLGVTLS